MANNDSSLEFSILGSIKEIPQKEWDALFGLKTIEGYGYQKTLEEANIEGVTLGYLVARRCKRPVLILPFFVMNFSLAILVSGILGKLMRKLKKSLTLRLLFFGAIAAEEFYLGINPEEDFNALFDKALIEIFRFSKKEKIQGVLFNNVSTSNSILAGYLKRKNFITMEAFPSTILEIKTNSLEEFIRGLSRNMRRDLKKKLKESSAIAKLTTVLREDVSDILPEVYKLYMNNFSDSDIHFEVLTADFFRNICRNMPQVAKYFITYDKEKIVAFNLFFAKEGFFIDKFIGFDYTVALKYHLYFTTFCHNLEWCIKNGLNNYQPGTTDYHPKLRLGAKLIPLYIYSKILNPLLHLFIKAIAKFIEPKNLDPILKGLSRDKYLPSYTLESPALKSGDE